MKKELKKELKKEHNRTFRSRPAIVILMALAVLIVVAFGAMAQGATDWNWQNPLPQGNGLWSVSALDANHVWKVGDYGTILFYDGTSWSNQASGTTNTLWSVYALDASHVWAVGVSGTILFYDGTSWSTQASGTTNQFWGVYALDASHVWAVGASGTICFFNGTSWSAQTSGVTVTLYSVSALGASQAWVVGDSGTILFYNGTSWSAQTSGITIGLYGVRTLDASHVWAVGASGTILFYNGTTWSAQTSGTTNSLYGISALSASQVWAVGASGTILFYNGTSWSAQTSGTTNELDAVCAINASQVWTVGASGTILFYNGTSWLVRFSSVTSSLLWNVSAYDASHVWAVGNGGTIIFYNGTSWSTQTSGTTNDLDAVCALDASHVWAMGASGTILCYNGTSWSAQTSGTTIRLWNVYAQDSSHVWAVGDAGTILFYNGTSWSAQTSGTTNSLYGISALSASQVWAVGDAGTILFYNGTSWSAQTSGITSALYNVSALNASHVWAVGPNGTILFYNGTSWSAQTSGTTNELDCVSILDASHVWVTGATGTVLFYDGSSWSIQSTKGCFSALYGVSALDLSHIWAVGTGGTIFFGEQLNTITASAGPGGGISPSGAVSINYGANQTFTITPDLHYHVTDVLVDGVSQGAITSYTFTNVTTDHTIAASFAIDTNTITASAGPGGNISPSGAVSVNYGANRTFAISPDTGYHVTDVLVDGVSQGAITSYTFTNVTANHTIAASFAIDTFAVNASVSGGHGAVDPATQTINYGSPASIDLQPDANYHVASITDNGSSMPIADPYVIASVTGTHNVVVTYAIDTNVITASAGANGSITPSGAVAVDYGANQTFTITPDLHYHIADVVVDGSSQGAITSYTFTNVTANHTIAASFAIDTFAVNASVSGGHGAVDPATQTINYGSPASIDLQPDANYHVASITDNGSSMPIADPYVIASVTGTHNVVVTYAIDTNVITASAGANGSITPSGAVAVDYGANQTFTITPDLHYHIADVVVDGSSQGAITSYTFTNVTAAHTIVASFTIDTNVITASAGANGSITPSGAVAVNYGSDQTFTITPDLHYHVADVLVDGSSQGAITSYTFTNVTAAHTIVASFTIDTNVITASAGANGSITPSGAVAVDYGANQTFTITPDLHYHIADVVVDGSSQGAITSYTFTNVTAAHTIVASFAIDTNVITASAGANGSITPSGAVAVNYGSDQTFTITPDLHYHVADVLVDGSSQGAITSYTFTNVTAAHTIVASFTIDTNVITASAGANGSITPSGAVAVDYGANQTFTITPDLHYHIADVVVDGSSQGAITSYTFTNVTTAHTIVASFTIDTNTITASAGANGSITPSGTVAVDYGANQTFTITPDLHYHIADVVVDGSSQGAITSYTFTNVTAAHTIVASFTIDTNVITASAGANGSITPSGAVSVDYGANQTFTITPDLHYHVADVLVDGSSQGAITSYTFNNVTAAHTIVASFTIDTNVITASAGANGSITPSGAVAVNYGSDQTFTITPGTGYHIADVLVDGSSVGTPTSYTFTNVTAPHTIAASFAIDTFSVNASVSGGHGSVDPAVQTRDWGSDAAININPDIDYRIASITDNGAPAAIADPYVIDSVTAAHDVVVTFAPAAATWYLAEGCTAGGMETYILVENPGTAPVTVDLTLMTTEGKLNPAALQDVRIPAGSRASFPLHDYITSFEVSTVVEATGGNVVCERSMYGNGRQWAHESIGVTAPAPTWYLAEGSTDGGLETYVLVQNPGAADLTASLTLMTGAGRQNPPDLQGVVIPAGSRRSFKLNDYVTDYDVSTVVEATGGVVCERAVYGNEGQWAHDSIGVTAPAPTWYLAEGCTDGNMETWVLVQNPNDTSVKVDLTFMTPEGPQDGPRGFSIPAGSRYSFKVNDYLTDYEVSTMVEATGGDVVCERSMYGEDRVWGTDSIGLTTPASTWYLAEGSTGGGMETWVLVQNPNDTPVKMDFTFMTPDGPRAGPQDVVIAASSRRSFELNEFITAYDLSIMLQSSGGGVACERSMYGNDRTWATDSIGYAP